MMRFRYCHFLHKPRQTIIVVWTLLLWAACLLSSDAEETTRKEVSPTPEIAPYLLRLAPDSAVLCWVTLDERRSEGTLTSMQERRAFRDASPTRFHRQVFQELLPATTYRYVVDDVFTETFRTPEATNEFRLVALGHTHGSEAPDHYPDELLVARAAELNPELVLHTGDTTWSAAYTEFARYFFAPFRELLAHTPVLVAPGNHDMGRGPFDVFRRLFPHDYGSEREAYYRVDYKNLRILALSYLTLGRTDSRQIEWLERELETSSKEFNIVVWGGTHLPDERQRAFFQALGRHRVDLLLGGDGGGVRVEAVEEIPYVYVGTSGAAPHSLFVVEVRDYELILRRVDARGAAPDPPLRIASRKDHPRVHDLLALQGLVREIQTPGDDSAKTVDDFDVPSLSAGTSLIARGISIPRRSFDGVRLSIDCRGTRRGMFRVHWSSREATAAGARIPNHQSQYLYVYPGRNELRLPLPVADPLTWREYHLSSIRVTMVLAGCEEGARLEALELFRH